MGFFNRLFNYFGNKNQKTLAVQPVQHAGVLHNPDVRGTWGRFSFNYGQIDSARKHNRRAKAVVRAR